MFDEFLICRGNGSRRIDAVGGKVIDGNPGARTFTGHRAIQWVAQAINGRLSEIWLSWNGPLVAPQTCGYSSSGSLKLDSVFVRQMLSFDDGLLESARVIIDGSGDREFKRELNTYLRRALSPGSLREVRFSNSANDRLVQLADMCAGAIARSYRTDRDFSDRWRKMLGPRIDDVWEFK
jgi:hypothetical protein